MIAIAYLGSAWDPEGDRQIWESAPWLSRFCPPLLTQASNSDCRSTRPSGLQHRPNFI